MARRYFIDWHAGTVTSYTDEELAEGAMLVGAGLTIYAAYGLICVALGAVLIAPFVTLFFLDRFVETIVVNNGLFFTLAGLLLFALKILSRKTARNFWVRLLFNAYIVIIVLYLTLYVLHFDSTIYSFARVIGNYAGEAHNSAILAIFQNDKYYSLTENNWFYETMVLLAERFVEFVRWSFEKVVAVDGSCFKAAMSEIDILCVLKTCVLYLGIGGFAVVGTVIFALILVIVVVVSIALPYCLALIAVLSVNSFINRVRFKGIAK